MHLRVSLRPERRGSDWPRRILLGPGRAIGRAYGSSAAIYGICPLVGPRLLKRITPSPNRDGTQAPSGVLTEYRSGKPLDPATAAGGFGRKFTSEVENPSILPRRLAVSGGFLLLEGHVLIVV